MKKRILGLMMVCFMFTGCQNMGNEQSGQKQIEEQINENTEQVGMEEKKEAAEETEQKLKNGEHINLSLGSQVQIDAIVEMPDKNDEQIEICEVKVDGFQGENIFETLLGKIPDERLEVNEKTKGVAQSYYYEGNLGPKLNDQDGSILANSMLNIQTKEGDKILKFLPIVYTNSAYGEGIQVINNQEDVVIPDKDKLLLECEGFIKQIGNWENVTLVDEYTFSNHQLQEQQEWTVQAAENDELAKEVDPSEFSNYTWSEADDCMLLFFQSYLNGIPVLCNEINRQDDLYIPMCKIQAIVTQTGIQYLMANNHYLVEKKKNEKLAEKDLIFQTLQNKFEMALTDPVTLEQMKLIYYPMTKGRNEEEYWECDMIPTWQFRFQENEMNNYIYINAIDGTEITG